MTSAVASVFRNLAGRLEVEECDLLNLQVEGVVNAEAFYYRLPTAEKLEAFLEEVIYPKEGFYETSGTDGSQHVSRRDRAGADEPSRRAWLRSGPAASLRRLWEASKTTAKHDLEALTQDKFEGPSRVSAPVLADMEARAVARGLPRLGDTEKPGALALAKVVDNFRAGGQFKYLAWEEFTSRDDEARAERQGLTRKESTLRFTIKDGSLAAEPGVPQFKKASVSDIVMLEDCLKVRAAAHDIADVASYDLYVRLTSSFLRTLKKEPPDRMRGPTLNEVRLVDRLIHEEVLEHVAKEEGNLNDGLEWYLGAGSSHKVWDFLEPVALEVPDRGVERAHAKRKAESALSLAGAASSGGLPAAPPGAKEVALCFVCGRTRKEHPKGRFCPQPSAAAAEGKGAGAKGDGKKKKAAKPPGELTDDGFRPPAGCAIRTPPSPTNQGGTKFCWEFHGVRGKKECKHAHCNRSHQCPKFKGGVVCMGSHRLVDCS